VVAGLLRLPAGPTQGIAGRRGSLLVDPAGRDWSSATNKACPARNTAPLIERDVSRRSPGWCPVRRARSPARRCIPRHRRRWRWACLPGWAGCTSTTAFRSRWAVPTARPGCCTRRSATGARPSQEYTEQPDLHDASGQARNTCEGAIRRIGARLSRVVVSLAARRARFPFTTREE
jgi:hypothetical protein